MDHHTHRYLHVTYLTMILTIIVATMSFVVVGAPPPSPGYYPSNKFSEVSFNEGYKTLWGPQHQKLDQTTLTLWLDRTSGSGFKSRNMYRNGYFGASIKLQSGYTAGVITSFYLSNNEDFPGHHDEIDIEFLGTTPDKPYTLQTNVYIKGSGDGYIVGREMRFHLWFDPTLDYHYYAILWTPMEIIFFVDDLPIRRYIRKSDDTFPLRPMYMYGSIWDASSWATENGKYKADYKYQPFVGKYKDFKISGCTTSDGGSCRSPSVSPTRSYGLSREQVSALLWTQRNYMVYDYCNDHSRDRSRIPEC